LQKETRKLKTINTQALKERLEGGRLALFDVRGDVDYERGHIPGAMTAPLGSLVFRVARVMNADSFVVVYSAGGGCGLAAEAAERLEHLGLHNVHCYEEGLKGWRLAGHDVIPSVNAKLHTQGEFLNVRPLVVNRKEAYGGAFRETASTEMGGAGG
jgi:rhodanese-related sulfurtransferase